MCSVASVMSNSLWSHEPTRPLHPWDSLHENNGVGCHALFQGIFLTQGSNSHLLCLLHCSRILYPLSHVGSLKQYSGHSGEGRKWMKGAQNRWDKSYYWKKKSISFRQYKVFSQVEKSWDRWLHWWILCNI